ncbi:hypothetical protein MMC11_000820 [Xylographa trunciseda]|nr:hypothetical protein [Xylographa trunciseda]
MLKQTLCAFALVTIYLLQAESHTFSQGGIDNILQQRADEFVEEEMMDVFPACWGRLTPAQARGVAADCPSHMEIIVAFIRSMSESGVGIVSRAGNTGLCEVTIIYETEMGTSHQSLVVFGHMIGHYYRRIMRECIRENSAGGEITVSLPRIQYFGVTIGMVSRVPSASGEESSESPGSNDLTIPPPIESSNGSPTFPLPVEFEPVESLEIGTSGEAASPTASARAGRCPGCLRGCFGCGIGTISSDQGG